MTLKRSRSDVAKITPATANWRVPSSSVGAEIIGTGSSEDLESRSSPESRALRLRSLPVWSLNSSIGSGGAFGEMDRLDPTGDLTMFLTQSSDWEVVAPRQTRGPQRSRIRFNP
ncbi:hypothetical protein CEP53_006801 [Fusarium sp. AF-6]|nr:hypothetical protein CEP53_006801 [Fusarium sp. AF-6]